MRAQEPHVAAKMLADIDQSREAAGASRATRIREETLLPIKVQQEQAQTAEIQARTRSVNELLSYQKRNIDANIEQSLAAAGASRANAEETRALYPQRAALLDKQNREYAELVIDGKRHTARAIEVLKERNDNIQHIARLTKEHQDKILAARKDARSELNMSTTAEGNIRLRTPGGKKDINDDSDLQPDADEFHATSKKPYVYMLTSEPGTLYGSRPKMKRFDLPTVDGHQYTAQEVYDAANAAGRNMTVQQYLEQVFYPMLRKPVPWNTGVESTIK